MSAFPTPKRYWSPRKLSDRNPRPPVPNNRDHFEVKASKDLLPKDRYKKARIISVDAATMKLRACFVREVVLVLQPGWVAKGPAFMFRGKSMAGSLLKVRRENRCPQEGLRMVQLMFGLDVDESL
jgi:hypothetical protein